LNAKELPSRRVSARQLYFRLVAKSFCAKGRFLGFWFVLLTQDLDRSPGAWAAISALFFSCGFYTKKHPISSVSIESSTFDESFLMDKLKTDPTSWEVRRHRKTPCCPR
jgi:hypothetical protein